MKFKKISTSLAMLIVGSIWTPATAEVITDGSAVIAIDSAALATATTLSVDRFFGGVEAATLTRSQILAAASSPPSSLDLTFGVNVPPIANPTGRQRRATDLDFDFAGFNPLAPLSSWSSSSPSGFGIAGGETVGLDGVIRYSSPLGTLITGDFALGYQSNRAAVYGVPALSGLVLVNLFDFPASSFDVGNAVITVSGHTLSISGDLLISPEFSDGFFGGAVTGVDVGNFHLTATAVPEASSVVMSLLAGATMVVGRLRYSREQSNADVA